MTEWFNATSLLEYRNNKKLHKKRFKDFWENSFVQEFIDNLMANGISDFCKTKKGRGGYTAMRYEIFPLFIEWSCPELIADYKAKYPEEYDRYLGLKKVSVTTTHKKMEIDFGNVLKSLCYGDNTEFYEQYIVDDKFIDFAVIHRNKDFGDTCILIEFDEVYHNKESQSIKDTDRDKALSEYFKKKKNFSYAFMVRVPYDKVGIAYTYLIPYLTGIETSMCSEKIQKLLGYKCLYLENV